MGLKPGIPKGTRDFNPVEMARRNYIFDTVRSVFNHYGFKQIETPSMERLDTLTGKYGEEGDQLIFKILNSGDYLKKVQDITRFNSAELVPKISEKALRYDLTVPFARFVVQHQNDINFPFKRYQIQPVWRADRPQKGRYREFYQCDVDVVGSDSLLYEVECIQIFDDVFQKLQIPEIEIKINNRKILSGLAEVAGIQDKLTPMTVALDKLDKIGAEKVKEELRSRAIHEEAIDTIAVLFDLQGSNEQKMSSLSKILSASEIGMKGIEELSFVFNTIKSLGLKAASLSFDPTLARGLNYYTGAIFEVKANSVEMGSICGGGRYDDLTGIFGLKDVSGVGISFGADRIYDVLLELRLFPKGLDTFTQVMFTHFGEKEVAFILPLLKKLRDAGIRAELYPDNVKLKKQMKYANDNHIPFVILVGEQEVEEQFLTVKNMESGEQEQVSPQSIVSYFENR